jgi:succinate-semialdehyde dehydrogenase/glutarate-semialdehyde dehydrogenase
MSRAIEYRTALRERSCLGLVNPLLLQESAFIAGKWVSAQERLQVINPATGQVLGSVPRLGEEHATQAVSAAHAALPAWRALAAKERSRILRRWYDLVIANTEDLARLMTVEQGKPLAEARAEIAYAAAYIEWFAEEGKRVYGDTIPGPHQSRRLVVLKQPIGVVGAITPWNFPAAMITRKVAPALAVGCTVVLKPSELTPFSALALALLAADAGVPAGVLNVVTGDPGPIGRVLTDDPRVRKFTFTGSTPVGKMLAARCMQTVKRVSLELGGNAPFIVFEDADIDKAVEGALASKFRNSGQTCVCANRFLVHEAVFAPFATKLAQRAQELVVGNGLEGETHQGPLINSAALGKVQQHIADALSQGAKLLTGGARCGSTGNFHQPTVITGLTPAMRLFREETFGPVAALASFSTEAEAVRLANDSSAGLAAYVYTRDASRVWRLGEALEYGMVALNTGVISSEVAPFGGVKESGMGREGSRYGLDDYLDIKLLCAEIEPQERTLEV